jgi:hypothetical protein
MIGGPEIMTGPGSCPSIAPIACGEVGPHAWLHHIQQKCQCAMNRKRFFHTTFQGFGAVHVAVAKRARWCSVSRLAKETDKTTGGATVRLVQHAPPPFLWKSQEYHHAESLAGSGDTIRGTSLPETVDFSDRSLHDALCVVRWRAPFAPTFRRSKTFPWSGHTFWRALVPVVGVRWAALCLGSAVTREQSRVFRTP